MLSFLTARLQTFTVTQFSAANDGNLATGTSGCPWSGTLCYGSATSIADCMSKCSSVSACGAVQFFWSSNMCYMKDATQSQVMRHWDSLGALVVPSASPTSTATSTSTSTRTS